MRRRPKCRSAPPAEAPIAPPIVTAIAQPIPELPPAPHAQDLSRLAQDLQIRRMHVEAVVQLLDEANTVPFITRYRKERTGGLDETVIRKIQSRIAQLRSLRDRKQTILKTIATQGKLNDELIAAILETDHPKRLEDLYLPYKPKKKSLAAEAARQGPRTAGAGHLELRPGRREPRRSGAGNGEP